MPEHCLAAYNMILIFYVLQPLIHRYKEQQPLVLFSNQRLLSCFCLFFSFSLPLPSAPQTAHRNRSLCHTEADKTASDLGIKAIVDEVCEAADEGYVVTVTDKEGYGGDIQITVGVTKDGTVSGVSILSISETAGLGMRATEAKFQEQYVGKNTDKFYVSKDGGEGEPIDAISGATITSRAFTGAVNTAIGYCKNAF